MQSQNFCISSVFARSVMASVVAASGLAMSGCAGGNMEQSLRHHEIGRAPIADLVLRHPDFPAQNPGAAAGSIGVESEIVNEFSAAEEDLNTEYLRRTRYAPPVLKPD
jgi:hypothetical protein